MRISSILFAILALSLLACEDQIKTASGTGMVIHFNLEGGFYGIITDKGEHFLPENLAADFQRDSLRVSFEGFLTDRPTAVQWGRTISLTKISIIR